MKTNKPAYLCLGSNDLNAKRYLAKAREGLNQKPGLQILAASSIYLTEPQNLRKQPWFHNQVIKLAASEAIQPAGLMKTALALETSLGRVRSGPRFGPRAIDIDILLYGNLVSDDPFCTLPHPRLLERAFALLPLLEIEPDIRICGKSASEWLAQLNWRQEGNKIFQ